MSEDEEFKVLMTRAANHALRELLAYYASAKIHRTPLPDPHDPHEYHALTQDELVILNRALKIYDDELRRGRERPVNWSTFSALQDKIKGWKA